MKKLLPILLLFIAVSNGVAQSIQSNQFNLYRDQAASCIQKGECHNAITIYLALVKSGDAASAEKIAELYESGKCLDRNQEEAAKWSEVKLLLERENHQLSPEENNKINELATRCEMIFPIEYEEDSKTDTVNKSQQVIPYIQESINTGGELIMHGAELNNIGISLDIIGGATAGLFISLGVHNGITGLAIAGGIIGAGLALAGLICNIKGNKCIKSGGDKLRNLEFCGNGIKLKF